MKQSSTHPHLFVQNQLHERLKCDKCSQPHQHNSKPSKNTGRHPLMRAPPAYCMMMPCVGVFPPWLTSDYCEVCWKSCIWFHWLVLQGFTGLTGLFLSKCEGIVSLRCTWASCWLCAQTGKLLKMGITGFVSTRSSCTTRWLEIRAALIIVTAICGSTWWIIRTIPWIYSHSRNICWKCSLSCVEGLQETLQKLMQRSCITFGGNLDLRSAMSKFDWPTTAELISLLSSAWAAQSHSSSPHPNN